MKTTTKKLRDVLDQAAHDMHKLLDEIDRSEPRDASAEPRLGFRLEQREGVWVTVDDGDGGWRVASIYEANLWLALQLARGKR